MSRRSRIIFTGIIPILLVSATILGIGLGGRIPGLPGEIFRKITGFMFTPVFLELTFAFLGLIAVFSINNIRLQKQGDEYISLEVQEDPEDQKP